MTDRFSRRDAVRFGAISGLGLLVGGAAKVRADAPASPATSPAAGESMQGAGFYRTKVGDLSVTLVSDGGLPFRPSDLFPKVDPDELAAAAKAGFASPGFFPGQVNTLLVQTGDATLLIDTGTGGAMAPTTGKLIPNLRRAGVRPADVTHVVLTHAHLDHIGGLLSADGKPTFPNAAVTMNQAEHDFWTSANPKMNGTLLPEAFQQQMIAGAKKILAAIKPKLDLKHPGDVIADVIKLVDAPGHTPGHVALQIGNGDATMTYLADTLHVAPIQFAHPDWHILFDSNPVMAAQTRQRLLGEMAEQRAMTGGAHLPFPALGHVARDGQAYRWAPIAWEW